MPVWNLPAFRENAIFPGASDFGSWKLADSSLRRLSASLKVDDNPFIDPHEPVRAIPDPWAQARTFAEALISGDDDHPLRVEALAQWRGLLALFALRELYANVYTLTPRQLTLDGPSLFDRVLTHLTPHIALGGAVDLWSRPLIFSLNDRPIAIGNPACLVSPGRLTPDLAFDGIPWFRSGLKDPTQCDMPVTQLFLLASWLRQLRTDLGAIQGAEGERVRQLLLQYANDCDRLGGDQALVANLGPTLYNELGEPYSKLFTTASIGRIAEPSATSRTKLKLDPELKLGNLKGVILVDEALTHDARFNRRTTLVWGTRTLGELLDNPQVFRETAEEAARSGWMIATGNDIFTPRVARFDNGAEISGNPTGMEEMLVPVRALALLMPGSLKDRIVARSGGGKAVFTLRLPIDDGSESGATFDYTRHFSTTPSEGEGLLVADEEWNIYHTALWPNFRSKAWSSYFARFNIPEHKIRYMVRPVHALSAPLIAHELADRETAYAAIERLREINGGSRLTPTKGRWLRSERQGTGEFEDIQFAATPFEAISYVDAFGERADAPAGLALIDLAPIEPVGGPFDVAVDFGTTNTVACFDDGEPIKFRDRLVYPLKFANPELSKQELLGARWLVRKFFPPEMRQTPTPTVALNRTPFPSQEAHHVFRNVVYFHSHEKHATNEETEELTKFKRVASQAKFNLKWTDDSEHAEASTDFLNQFVMMVAAEALAAQKDPRRIRWRFSVPDSLDGEMRLNFKTNLRDITAKISTEITDPSDILRELYSEGLSAAEFILDGGAGFTRASLNLVLDIGGGTTDITVWDYGPIHWIGSFRLAGQNFFTRTISQNPGILAPIGLGHWQGLFEFREGAVEGVSRADIPHLAEMLFSGPALQQAIDEHWNSRLSLDTGKDLRMVGQVFLAGLAWYMGRVVRQLVVDGKLREDQLENPAFALCGRGAGIFKKMHGGGRADELSGTTKALELFSVAAGLGENSRPQLFTTPDAKLEVVRGMIRSTGDKRALAENASTFYLTGIGLEFDGGGEMTPEAKAQRSSLPSKVRSVDLSEFDAFVAALADKVDIEIDLQESNRQGARTAIDLAVRKSINDLLDNPDVKHELEPPFITALRALIDIMASPAADRNHKIRMEYRK